MSLYRDPGCSDCRAVTSGDCGKHGPVMIVTSVVSAQHAALDLTALLAEASDRVTELTPIAYRLRQRHSPYVDEGAAKLCDQSKSVIMALREALVQSQAECERYKTEAWVQGDALKEAESQLAQSQAEVARLQEAQHQIGADATGHLLRCARVNGVWSCHTGCAVARAEASDGSLAALAPIEQEMRMHARDIEAMRNPDDTNAQVAARSMQCWADALAAARGGAR